MEEEYRPRRKNAIEVAMKVSKKLSLQASMINDYIGKRDKKY